MKTEGYSDRQDNAHYTEYSTNFSELTYCLCIPKYGQLHATRGGLRTHLSKHNTGRHSSCHGSLPGRGQHNAAHDAGIDPRGVSAVTRHLRNFTAREVDEAMEALVAREEIRVDDGWVVVRRHEGG